MEGDDHVLACLQIFRNNPIHWDWEVSVSYKLQRMLLHQPSLSPTPKSRRPWMTLLVPLIGAGRHYMITTALLYAVYHSHSGTRLSIVLHGAADRSGGSRILEADWL